MGWVVNDTYPAASPPGKTRYPLYRRLSGLQGRSRRVWKISPTPGFDLQPVESRYTDWAIPAHLVNVCCFEIDELQFGKIIAENKVALMYSVDILYDFDVSLTVCLSIFIYVISQLDAQHFCFTISLFHASTCFGHMCLSSGGQNWYHHTYRCDDTRGCVIEQA